MCVAGFSRLLFGIAAVAGAEQFFEVVAAKGDHGPAALRALLRPLKLRDASPSLTGLATDLGVDVMGLTRHAIIQRLVLTLCPLTSPLRSAEVKRKFWRCLERHRGLEQETLEARIEATLGEDQCAEFRHGLLAVFLGITVEAVAGRHLSARDELQLLDAKLSEAAACVSDMEQWLPQSIPPSWTAVVTRLQETTMPRLSWPAQRALLAVVLNARWNERRGGWEGLTKSGFDSFWGGFVVCYAAPGWWRLAGASDCADPIDVAERLWALATLEQEAASQETDGFKDRREALEAAFFLRLGCSANVYSV